MIQHIIVMRQSYQINMKSVNKLFQQHIISIAIFTIVCIFIATGCMKNFNKNNAKLTEEMWSEKLENEYVTDGYCMHIITVDKKNFRKI